MLLGFNSLLAAVAALGVVLALVWLGARAARLTGLAPRPSGARMLALQDTIALNSAGACWWCGAAHATSCC